ncbi:hypothetical protein AB0I61_32865 [Polymorphospora rubra]|uniref:hypothetical protein n=1 Tax=Polymorphospora rubra TaxID=338584 RepID=UPI0033ED76E9
MTKSQLCARCQTRPVAYRGRATCYECVPRASTPQWCEHCGVNRVAYSGRGTCYDCVPKALTPQLCDRCGVAPIAYFGRTTCCDCVPRARKSPLRCKKCGSTSDYFTAGRCRRCHRKAPVIDSCRDCLAWGVTRRREWLCQGCTAWRIRFPTPQQCRSCQRIVPVNRRGDCRLCMRQATAVRPAHQRVDVVEANREGQQLFLADLFRQRRPEPIPAAVRRTRPHRYPVTHQQLVLVPTAPDFVAGRRNGFGEPPLPDLAAYLDDVLVEHAAAYGWAKATMVDTRSAIRILLATQQTPGAAITSSEVAQLRTIDLSSTRGVCAVLQQAGMLHEDREPTIDAWFRRQQHGIAEHMADELRQWFEMLRDGSTTPPRALPRPRKSVAGLVRFTVPALRTWSRDGHQSLRAALTALVGFHALRPHQIVAIQLHQFRDGRLHLPDRVIPLADPVRHRLAAWLDHRHRRWPATANPHVFLNHYNGTRTSAADPTWVTKTIGVSAQSLRMDRILHEAIANAGDVRRLTDMFGISVTTAERYAFTGLEPGDDATGS